MDKEAVKQVYRACDRDDDVGLTGVGSDAFRIVALAYTVQEPSSARNAARLYHSMGEGRASDLPIGDPEYVGGLFELALRQPRDSPVSRATAIAVGFSIIPDSELGNATEEDRYLVLHSAALLAQSIAGDLGRALVSDWPVSRKSRITGFHWTAATIGLVLLAVILLN